MDRPGSSRTVTPSSRSAGSSAIAYSRCVGGVSSRWRMPRPPPTSTVRIAIARSRRALTSDARRATASAKGAALVSCEPMCMSAPTTSTPLRLAASSYASSACANGIPNFEVLSPVAIYGWVCGSTSGFTRSATGARTPSSRATSLSELRTLDEGARELGVRAPVALRVNPDVDPQTHPYIATGLKTSKFGIPFAQALEAYEEAASLKGVEVVGADMHIGSQLTKAAPFADAVARLASLVKALRERAIAIRTVDVGGGLGIRHREETPPTHREYAMALLPALRELGVTVLLEPGRSIVGNAGVLLTRVLYRKDTGNKKFVVIDAAMNDPIRPPLYDSYHEVRPVSEARLGGPTEKVDVVGPICESGDFLAKDRELARTEEGDLLAVMSAGAYGFAMASNYNTRPRAAEVLVDGNRYTIVRRRETYEDLVAGETTP